jgi:putative endonuclease
MNKNRTVLYVGVTSKLKQRIRTHQDNPAGFVKQYNVHYCVYFEKVLGMMNAINREKQIKRWSRDKKLALIKKMNPELKFSNEEIFGES